ncbi:ThuA domain-containing protein [Niveispirillum sp. KHB5.9]|uniref:ThuA domain-containing protein n=1 Tax=Niveispirillum sp. KHB5.9 TaxID=3400269 RepID=UPI003A872AE9
MSKPIDVCLIAGGKYHDIDFARLELLKLLGEHERLRVRVLNDFGDAASIRDADLLITYTCDIVPDAAGLAALRHFLGRGRRWFALHGTNSILNFLADGKVDCPDCAPDFMEMLGSQFQAHPPIGRFKVKVADKTHELTRDLRDFVVEDEQYLCDFRPGNHALLTTRFAGATPEFIRDDWPDGEHMVMYTRASHGGEVLYLTLGHCRGRYDLRPLADFYPYVERCAWQHPVYHELLRRGIRWGMGV